MRALLYLYVKFIMKMCTSSQIYRKDDDSSVIHDL